MSALARLRLRPLQVLWVVLALVGGGPAADALDGRSSPVVWLLAVVGWVAWAAALVAMLVPRTSSLTVVRIVVPAAWLAAVVAVAAGDTSSVLDAVTVLVATVALLLALAPWVTDAFVDGSSYGPERRIALRTPVAIAVLAGIAWTAVVAGALAGPLLLASSQWVAGGVAVVVGAGATFAGTRSLHQLSRRWLVLVPTGMVLHDPITMPEPQLFLRQTMRRLGPALAEDDAVAGEGDGDEGSPITEDLTAGASGLVMELALSEPVELLVHQGRRGSTLRQVDRVLFSPARPAELLAAAREKRLPVS